MFNIFQKPKKLVTHNGTFHTDDVFACAILQLILEQRGESFNVTRTRNPEIIHAGDFVFDVGGEYDPLKNRYDHHQHGGAGERENSVPYAAAGLTWKHFGMELCMNQKICDYIDAKVMQPIDAIDNGTDITKPLIEDLFPYSIQSVIHSFRPTWQEYEKTDDEQFLIAVDFAKKIFSRELIKAESRIDANDRVVSYYEKSDNKKIIIIDGDENFSREDILPVLTHFDEPVYFVYQKSHGGSWKTEAMRKQNDGFELRKPLPEHWAGKRDQDLVEATTISDAEFCHNGRFLIVSKSKESAIKLAQLALEDKE